MPERKIKWGIMGAGTISRKFASDLVHSSRADLVAVTSRTQGKAVKFAKDFDIERTYGTYEDFVKDDEIDIVYIGTLHPLHKNGVLQCLNAGKAVLCEKPFAMNAKEAEEMIRAARENDTFLMEAMWTRYLPSIVQTRKWIEEGAIGEVKTVTANFGFNIGWNPESRLLDKKLGGGALLDAGIYPVSFASMIFGKQPDKIMSSAYIGETEVDERFSALFEYDGNRTALLNSGVRLQFENDAYIYGTDGHIHVPNFLFSNSATLHRSDGTTVNFTAHRELNGYIYEAEEAMDCLQAGRKESSIMPLQETLDIMKTLDAMRAQWGLTYPETVQ